MKAPFMYDAKGEVSNNIEISIENNKSGYRLIMKPDFDWLNSEEREYLIIIDPYIKNESTASTVEDSTVMNLQLEYYKADGTSNGSEGDTWGIVDDGQWKKRERE